MAKKARSRKQARKESPEISELLVLELQEIHSAENQLSRMLPRVLKAVESEKLGQMLELRQEQGERLIEEVEACLEELEETPGRKKNVAAEGLINDMREHIQELEAGPALDAVLIAAVQKTEHYCIAAWGTAKALGDATDSKATVKSMERALQEGKELDEQLTQLALDEITPALQAQAGGGEEEEEEGDDSGDEGEDDEEIKMPTRSNRKGGGERRVSR